MRPLESPRTAGYPATGWPARSIRPYWSIEAGLLREERAGSRSRSSGLRLGVLAHLLLLLRAHRIDLRSHVRGVPETAQAKLRFAGLDHAEARITTATNRMNAFHGAPARSRE